MEASSASGSQWPVQNVRATVSVFVTLGGLFFLGEGTAPADVRRALRVLLAVQVLVAVVAASVRPFSELAFGILVPMLGLGMITLWAARHGAFAPKDADDQRAEDRPRPGSPRQ